MIIDGVEWDVYELMDALSRSLSVRIMFFYEIGQYAASQWCRRWM